MGKKCISDFERKGNRVKYKGEWYVIDKPKPSNRKGKKKKVLANKNGCLKVIHFGDVNYKHNYSEKARENYLKRSAGIRNAAGELTKNDKHSANYWSRRVLWK